MKILLWVLVALAVAMWLIHEKKQRVKAQRNNPPPPLGVPEAMVCCAHCGTYVPASEAVTHQSGLQFCCEEHRLQHSSRGTSA